MAPTCSKLALKATAASNPAEVKIRKPRYEKIKVIPREGDVDFEMVTKFEGHCFKAGCNGKKIGDLKRHLKFVHLGFMNKCPHCPQEYSSHGALAGHIKKYHATSTKPPGRRPRDTIIPESGEIDVELLTTLSGFCDMRGCKKQIKKNLREHYTNVHKKVKRQCTECGKFVLLTSYDDHLKIHTEPVRCGICNLAIKCVSACESHIKVHHPGSSRHDQKAMTPEEIEEFIVEQNEKRDRPRNQRQREVKIRNHSGLLAEYEGRLINASDDISIRASRLATKFRAVIDVGANRPILNAAFVTVWDPIKKSPKVVMEIVEKVEASDALNGNQFFKDPKLQHSQPKDADFKGFHKGHLCAASNFRLLLLVAATYYYTNVVAMYLEFNLGMKRLMEIFVQELANEFGEVTVFHLVFTETDKKTDGPSGVALASSFGTVAIVKKADGLHLLAWELPHQRIQHAISYYVRNPFSLFRKAGFQFMMPESLFVFVSSDAP